MHAFKRTKLQKIVTIFRDKNKPRMSLQMYLFGVMFHSGPVRLGEEWGGPPEIKVIFTGVDPTSVLEIHAEDTCQSLVREIFFQ